MGVYGTDAIFTMTYGGLDVATLQQRNNNVINVGTGGPFDSAHRATGITFASAFSGGLGDGKFTSIQIMRNTIFGVQAERRGISLWNDDTANSPGGNIVSPQVVGNVISGVGGSGSKGIQLLGLVSDAKLVNNYLSDLAIGIHLRDWAGAPSGTKIIANRFQDVTTLVSTDPGVAGTKQHADHLIAP